MSLDQLIDVLMVQPRVQLTPTERNTGLEPRYEYKPLSNLIYTRDQQITTAKGLVMGRLQSTQREPEVKLLSYCFKKLGTTSKPPSALTLCQESAFWAPLRSPVT